MGFRVDSPGILTTIQDSGRFNYEKFGISPSGASDFVSFTTANILVGNSWTESAIELTISGASLSFDEDCIIAITGADMSPKINGKPCDMYRALQVRAGDVLTLGLTRDYCRAYIAFHGGLDVPLIMGSRSAAIQNHIGQKLRKGDYVSLLKNDNYVPNLASRFTAPPEKISGEKTVRVILGPQDDAFTDEGMQNFLNTPYTVSKDFDRMGCRLEGARITHKSDCNIISDGMVTGAVQVPGSGQPIIMMSERQTVGGYTKIAVVITADLPLVAQSKTGDVLRFRAVSIKEAHEALRKLNDGFRLLQERLDNVRTYRVKVNGEIHDVTVEQLS